MVIITTNSSVRRGGSYDVDEVLNRDFENRQDRNLLLSTACERIRPGLSRTKLLWKSVARVGLVHERVGEEIEQKWQLKLPGIVDL
jgi:hypothetical protein